MSSPAAAGASFAAWTAQRVEVYLALARPDGGLVTVRSRTGRPSLPGAVLAHGEPPRVAARRAVARLADVAPPAESLRLHQVFSDVLPRPGHPGLHVLRLVFQPDRGVPLPVDEGLLHAPAPAPVADAIPGAPARVQRPAAYAIVVRDGRVLLTRVAGSGIWTLPGGGIDHGEHPAEAVRRETFEETGLELRTARLVDVDSLHFTGRSPRAVIEDYHGVRLLYRGTVSGNAEPAVQDVGGTTDAAAWCPLAGLTRLRLSSVVGPALALPT